MAIEFYDGKPVFIKCPADLWTFSWAIESLDDVIGDEHFIRKDPKCRHAWYLLQCAVEEAMERFSLHSGSCNIADMVTLALSDELPEPWEVADNDRA